LQPQIYSPQWLAVAIAQYMEVFIVTRQTEEEEKFLRHSSNMGNVEVTEEELMTVLITPFTIF
jgi:hypothetical protein